MTSDPNATERAVSTPRRHAPSIPTRFDSELFDRLLTAAAIDYTGTHCVVSFAGRVDADRLVRAVSLILHAEPILACRWTEHWFRPFWRRRDTVDATDFCEVRDSSTCRFEDFIAVPPDFPVRVLLLRGDSDLLCIKLDHRAGDGAAVRDYAYLLADIYSRLGDDPDYVPPPNLDSRRGMQQLRERFGLRETLRICRQSVRLMRRRGRPSGTWTFPLPQNEALESAHLRLETDRVRAILQYALRRRTTLSQVLVAALFLAVCHARPQSSDRPLPVRVLVDLRRYLPAKRAAGLCNLYGFAVVSIDPRSAHSLDDVVKQVRDQMVEAQRSRYLGLPISFFAVEGPPVIRHVVELIPYWFLKRAAQRSQRRSASSPGRDVTGQVLFTDLGEFEPDRLIFAGADIADAFATGGVFKEMTTSRGWAGGGSFGMAASRFRGSLTLSLGYGTRDFLTGLREDLLRILPA